MSTVLGADFPSILEAARKGAEWAWTSIYRELAPPVLGYFRARGASEPEDLTAEVFLQVVRDLGRFDGGEREFRAWVLTIAHHRLVDERRQRARRPVELRPEVAADAGASDPADAELLRAIGTDRVRWVIAQLSPDQRDVLLLRVLGELTVGEVARVVGKRPGAVKALQRRGLAAIRRAFAKEGVPL